MQYWTLKRLLRDVASCELFIDGWVCDMLPVMQGAGVPTEAARLPPRSASRSSMLLA